MELSEEEPSDKEIQAEFQFFDPVEEDSDAIQELLTSQLRGIEVDIPSLTKSIIQQVPTLKRVRKMRFFQKTVGSVLKCGEGEDAYLCGLISVFNVQYHHEVKWIQQMKTFIEGSFQDAQKKEIFKQVISCRRLN